MLHESLFVVIIIHINRTLIALKSINENRDVKGIFWASVQLPIGSFVEILDVPIKSVCEWTPL